MTKKNDWVAVQMDFEAGCSANLDFEAGMEKEKELKPPAREPWLMLTLATPLSHQFQNVSLTMSQAEAEARGQYIFINSSHQQP